jgi:hypothetical protein
MAKSCILQCSCDAKALKHLGIGGGGMVFYCSVQAKPNNVEGIIEKVTLSLKVFPCTSCVSGNKSSGSVTQALH